MLRPSGALSGCGRLSVPCTADADESASGRGIDGAPSGACTQATDEHHNIIIIRAAWSILVARLTGPSDAAFGGAWHVVC